MKEIKKRWLLIVNLFLIIPVIILIYFDCPFNLTLKMNTENLVKTLSVGFLLSSIFYVIVVYFPQQERRKSVKKALEGELKELEEYMLMHILLIRAWNDNNDLIKIDEDSIQIPELNKYVLLEKTLKFQKVSSKKHYLYGKPSTSEPRDPEKTMRIEFLQNYARKIFDVATFLTNLPSIDTQETQLIKTLLKIRNSGYIDVLLKYDEEGTIGGFGLSFKKFYSLYKKLKPTYTNYYDLEKSFIMESELE